MMAHTENRCSFPREAVTACGIRLLTMWRVKAGHDYRRMAEHSRHDSHTKIHQAGRNMVAVRTDHGEGVIKVKGRQHTLTRGSLLLFDFPSLEEYHTHGQRWNFWWVEFSTDEALHLPIHHTLSDIPTLSHEAARCEQVFDHLSSERIEHRCLAAAIWQSLFHEWWVGSGVGNHLPSREETAVQQVLDAIKRQPSHDWNLSNMASICSMSISSLRLAFMKVLGKSPGQVRNSLRLAHAFEILRRGDRSVSEVADNLGFCDPFHFSKAFKKEYGFNPSAIHQHTR